VGDERRGGADRRANPVPASRGSYKPAAPKPAKISN
jgi:hypothetical protein